MNIQKVLFLSVSVLSATEIFCTRQRSAPASKPSSASRSSTFSRPSVSHSSSNSIVPKQVSSVRASSTVQEKSHEHSRPSMGTAAAAIGAAAVTGATLGVLASENLDNSSSCRSSSNDHTSTPLHSSYAPYSNRSYFSDAEYPMRYTRSTGYMGSTNNNDSSKFFLRYMASAIVGGGCGWSVWSSKNILNVIKNQVKEGINPHNVQLGVASCTAMITAMLVNMGLQQVQNINESSNLKK